MEGLAMTKTRHSSSTDERIERQKRLDEAADQLLGRAQGPAKEQKPSDRASKVVQILQGLAARSVKATK